MKIALTLACVCLLFAPAALGQTAGLKVTVTVNNVTSSAGTIRGSLCADREIFGKSSCAVVSASAPAKTGSVDIVFTGVPAGTYGLVVYHDQDADGRFSVMTEPMAFGNNAIDLPPVFENTLLKVTADLKTETTLFKMIP